MNTKEKAVFIIEVVITVAVLWVVLVILWDSYMDMISFFSHLFS